MTLQRMALLGATSQLWTPSRITTALWLDAADLNTITTVSGAVSQWNDKSGNARHASQATAGLRPTYSSTGFNNLPGISFLNSQLNFPANFAQVSGQNIFAVADTTSLGSGYRGFLQRTSGSVNNMALYFGGDTVGGTGFDYRPMVYWNNGARAIWPTAVQSKAIFRWSFATGASALTQVNGGTAQTGSFGASELTNWLSIGLGVTQPANVPYAEIIITPSTPSTNDLQRIEGYLAWKWGLVSNLPAGHPYKSAAPTI